MRIVFMGTPEFAVATLDAILNEGFDIAAVITMPDKESGRGLELQASPVKKYALEKGLKVLQPVNLKDPDFIGLLRSLKADIQVVVAFRMLPEVVWNMPPSGTYNLHASLLPQYRGAAPIHWAIINGEKETGLTTFKLQHEIDTGSILLQEKVTIGDDETLGELYEKMMHKGASLMVKSLHLIERGNYVLKAQDTSVPLKHAPKLFKEDAFVRWDKMPEEIHNKVRGLNPFPVAWSIMKNEGKEISIKLFRTQKELCNHTHYSGQIISDNKTYLKVACNNGFVYVLELQAPGKKRLEIKEFLQGFRISDDSFFLNAL